MQTSGELRFESFTCYSIEHATVSKNISVQSFGTRPFPTKIAKYHRMPENPKNPKKTDVFRNNFISPPGNTRERRGSDFWIQNENLHQTVNISTQPHLRSSPKQSPTSEFVRTQK